MEMKVEDCLPGIALGVHHQAITALLVTPRPRHFGGSQVEVPNQVGIRNRQVIHRFDVLEWNQENVRWRLRPDVFKSQAMVIAIDDRGGNLPVPDLAENAVDHERLLYNGQGSRHEKPGSGAQEPGNIRTRTNGHSDRTTSSPGDAPASAMA